MLRNNLFNQWVSVLVFLYNFECNKKGLKELYNPRFLSDTKYVHVSKISKILNITYGNTFEIIKDVLVPLGLVNVESVGRCSLISLTEKGLDVGKSFDKAIKDLGVSN